MYTTFCIQQNVVYPFSHFTNTGWVKREKKQPLSEIRYTFSLRHVYSFLMKLLYVLYLVAVE